MAKAGPDRALRKVRQATYVGSTIEHYDFLAYGTAAALAFPTVFFSHLSPVMATIASMGTFATAFLSRPLGAAVFGGMGDRIGRKRTLLLTLAIMGVATAGVGLVPSTADIGPLAPLILVALRLAQGFAVGGEWAGAVLLGVESAPPGKRGHYGMFTQLGLGSALVLVNLVFLLVHLTIGDHSTAFFTWGWRLPFLLSALLIGTALYVGLQVGQTAEFSESRGADSPRRPIADMLRTQWPEVLLTAGTVMAVFMLVYQAGTYVTHYAAVHLHYSKTVVLLAGVIGGLAATACIAVAAILSDLFGPRRLIVVGLALAAPWSMLLFPLIETGRPVVFTLAMVVTYGIIGTAMGPLASYLAPIFAARYRYTGIAVSYNLGGILGGAIPPVVSPALLDSFGSWAVGLMMGAMAIAGLISALLMGGSNRPDQAAGA